MLLVGLPLALIVFTAVVALLLAAHERDVTDGKRDQAAAREAAAVSDRFESTVARLSTTGGLFAANPTVTEPQFRLFAKTLLTEPTLDNVAYIQRVSAAGRPALERRLGLPVTDRITRRARPSPRRAVHYPYTLTGVPPDPPRTGLLDAGSEPQRAATLRRARDEARARSTPALRTLGKGRPSLLVYAPIYTSAVAPRTVAQRRARLRGFAVGVMGLEHLVGPARRDSVQVLERGRRIAGPARLDNTTDARVKLAGRDFTVRARTGLTPDYTPAIAVAVGGIVLALAIGIVLLTLVRRDAYAHRLVDQRLAERQELEAELRRMAVEDALTGLPNRRGLNERLDTELTSARRYGGGALVLLDLDEFKEINDSRGHSAGDEVLKRVAELLLMRLRESDHVARLGGDEFALVLPRVDQAGARDAGDSIRALLRGDSSLTRLYGRPVTASVGVAMMTGEAGLDAERLLARADQAMYVAKREGRDRTAIAGEPAPATA